VNNKCRCCDNPLADGEVELCERCRDLLRVMNPDIPMRQRVGMLRENLQAERKKTQKLLAEDVKMAQCKHCVWCRYVDKPNRKIACSSPRCIHGIRI
jgi:hypothetical protein